MRTPQEHVFPLRTDGVPTKSSPTYIALTGGPLHRRNFLSSPLPGGPHAARPTGPIGTSCTTPCYPADRTSTLHTPDQTCEMTYITTREIRTLIGIDPLPSTDRQGSTDGESFLATTPHLTREVPDHVMTVGDATQRFPPWQEVPCATFWATPPLPRHR